MKGNPSFQFYPNDWLADPISCCSMEAQGVWLNLMLLMHRCEPYGHLAMNGKPLPRSFLARRCNVSEASFDRIMDELMNAGVPSINTDGVIYSRRMVRDEVEREKDRVLKRNQRDRKALKKGGADEGTDTSDECPVNVRQMSGECPVNVRSMSGECPPLSSSSSSLTPVVPVSGTVKVAVMGGFAEFWKLYPRKVGKKAAERAWKRGRCGEQLEKILAAVRAQAGSDQWERDGGQYVPHPATWLNQGRWDDEVENFEKKEARADSWDGPSKRDVFTGEVL